MTSNGSSRPTVQIAFSDTQDRLREHPMNHNTNIVPAAYRRDAEARERKKQVKHTATVGTSQTAASK